jgi:peptidyl-prolyl cis-trans isomerase A (cyclophilin A)
MMVFKKRFLWAFLLLSASFVSAEKPIELVMLTSEGMIEISLYADKAPITVNNFLRYVDSKRLDGSSFYRVVRYDNDNGLPKIEVIQGGPARGEKSFPAIQHESTKDTGILHTDGIISMARAGLGTATSQFFICIGDQPGLNFGQPRNADMQGFATFGKVTKGMEVVKKIKNLPADIETGSAYTKGQYLNKPVIIVSVSRK